MMMQSRPQVHNTVLTAYEYVCNIRIEKVVSYVLVTEVACSMLRVKPRCVEYVTSYLGLREEEPPTAHPMSLTWCLI